MKLTLTDTRHESPDAISFMFRPEAALSWQPGQFMVYHLPHPDMDDRKDERYFSISSAPEEGHVMLTTRFSDKSSTFKKALKEMAPGQTIDADAPDGDFTLPDPTEDTVFIAGGIGITPYRAILEDLEAKGLPIHTTLLYANRSADFIFRDELDALARKHKGFKIVYFISPDRIDEAAIRQNVPDLNRPVFYVSGPEPMVEAFDKMLKEMQIPERHIKTDYFPGYNWP